MMGTAFYAGVAIVIILALVVVFAIVLAPRKIANDVMFQVIGDAPTIPYSDRAEEGALLASAEKRRPSGIPFEAFAP